MGHRVNSQRGQNRLKRAQQRLGVRLQRLLALPHRLKHVRRTVHDQEGGQKDARMHVLRRAVAVPRQAVNVLQRRFGGGDHGRFAQPRHELTKAERLHLRVRQPTRFERVHDAGQGASVHLGMGLH